MLHYLRSERGATAGEYALLLSLFCCAIIMAALVVSDSIGGAVRRGADLFATTDNAATPAAAPDPADCSGNKGKGRGQGKCNDKGKGDTNH